MARKRSTEGKIENRNTLGRLREDALFPVSPTRASLPSGYAGILSDLKQRIQQDAPAHGHGRELGYGTALLGHREDDPGPAG